MKRPSNGKRGRWSTPALVRLRNLFPTTDIQRVASLLDRSVESVRTQGKRLFRRPLEIGEWHPDDDALLRRAWGVVALEDLTAILGRTPEDVRRRAGELRGQLRHGDWSARELAALKELYGSRSDRDLEVSLSRPRFQIEEQARRLCLRKDKRGPSRGSARMPRWSEPEVERLIAVYPERTNLEIAREMGRSVVSVANKASQLGLVKGERLRRRIAATNAASRTRR